MRDHFKMKKIVVLLFLTSFGLLKSIAAKEKSAETEKKRFNNILFIGDSHSAGNFGAAVDHFLRSQAQNVTTIASCGSSPSNWMPDSSQKIATTCGFRYKTKENQKNDYHPRLIKCPTDQIKICSLRDAVEAVKPNITVIALGTNIVSSEISKKKIFSELNNISTMLEQTKKANSQCIWIGPPNLLRKDLAKGLDSGIEKISAIVKKNNCRYIDSKPLTMNLKMDPKGVHYLPQSASLWGDRVVPELKKNLDAIATIDEKNHAQRLNAAPPKQGRGIK